MKADEVVFDVADVLGLFDTLNNRYTLSSDYIPSILLRQLAAPLALALFILFKESLIAGKVLSIQKMHMYSYS